MHKVCLNTEQLEACYSFADRKPKKDENVWFENVWKSFEGCEVLREYNKHQRRLLSKNHQIEYYNGNHTDYIDMLTLVQALVDNEHEIYIRDFSMKLFSDSKRVEQLSSAAGTLLFAYGDYQEKITIENLTSFHDFSKEKTKPLTENDRKRLIKLAETYPEHQQIIHYMLQYNCKLEQEAVGEIYL